MKSKVPVDDALDVFGVHGMAGIFGALATGLFANVAVNSAGANGLFHGNPKLVLIQGAGVLATLAWSGILSFGILKAIDVTIGLRVAKTDEQEGLDLSENGELAYGVFGGTMVEPREALPPHPSPVLHAPLLVPTES